jgi:hypothetical protein
MEDVLDVYQRPYDPEYPQVCVDEISKTLRSTPRGSLPIEPGQPRREDYEYKRHGQCALFLVIEPLQGFRRVWVSPQRTKLDFALILKELIDEVYPDAKKIVLVVDNLNTHTPTSLYEAFEPAEAKRILDRLEFHYTPKHGSWLNMVEIEIGVLCEQCLADRIPDEQTLSRQIAAWELARNQQRATINWQFTTIDARNKLKRLYPAISKSS